MHIHSARFVRIATLLLACTAGRAMPQAGVEWVRFSAQPDQLGPGVTLLSDQSTDAAFAVADLDQDGWPDVVAARKGPGTSTIKRTDRLLMNLSGVLTDQTAEFAASSDVPGDAGFLTPTNHPAVKVADVDGDGWLDVIFTSTLSDGDPKAISHPRVYRNLGSGDAWLGLRHEDARIPQLVTVGGLAAAPWFSQLDAADVTADGAADLYFVDHDSTETGLVEPAGHDLNDRLLVNDGNGYFFDASAGSLTTTQLLSAFGHSVQLVDLNADGLRDILKTTNCANPTGAFIFYNNPASAGDFKTLGVQQLAANSPQNALAGDLNHDSLPDIVEVDHSNDGFFLGTGYTALNKLIVSAKQTFTFVTGGDDGFGRNIVLRDLDLDGWDDVIITDVDPDLPGCQRRMHVYHNLGGAPGGTPVLKEESQFLNGGTGPGWKGVVGLSAADQKGTYAVACADFDLDGDSDLLIGRCVGTSYYSNEVIHGLCQADLGFGGPGAVTIALCGDDLTQAGSLATLELGGASAGDTIVLALSLTAGAIPFKGGTLVPVPVLALVGPFAADGSGGFSAPVPGAGGPPVHLILQAIVKQGTAFHLSNALDVLMGV